MYYAAHYKTSNLECTTEINGELVLARTLHGFDTKAERDAFCELTHAYNRPCLAVTRRELTAREVREAQLNAEMRSALEEA
jgi:hypothetical protein